MSEIERQGPNFKQIRRLVQSAAFSAAVLFPGAHVANAQSSGSESSTGDSSCSVQTSPDVLAHTTIISTADAPASPTGAEFIPYKGAALSQILAESGYPDEIMMQVTPFFDNHPGKPLQDPRTYPTYAGANAEVEYPDHSKTVYFQSPHLPKADASESTYINTDANGKMLYGRVAIPLINGNPIGSREVEGKFGYGKPDYEYDDPNDNNAHVAVYLSEGYEFRSAFFIPPPTWNGNRIVSAIGIFDRMTGPDKQKNIDTYRGLVGNFPHQTY